MIPTTTFLDQMINDIDLCKNYASTHWSTAPTEALTWQDSRFNWSVDNIMLHLTAFATHYIPIIKSQIQQAQKENIAPKTDFSYNSELEGFFNSLSYQGLNHMESVGHFQEIDTEFADTYKSVPPDFFDIQDQLIYLLNQAKSVNIEVIPIPSIIADFDFRLGDCFLFIVKHQILHFAQAEVIMDSFMKSKVLV